MKMLLKESKIQIMGNVVCKVSCGILMLAITSMGAHAQNEIKEPKIHLLLATIETPDTRTDVMQKQVTLPPQQIPYSDADLQSLSGNALSSAQWKNAVAASEYRTANARIFYDEYRRRIAEQKRIAEKAGNTKVGRNLILGRDWFASAMMEKYSDLFGIVFRIDDQEAQEEKFYSDMSALDVEKCAYFVKIVVNDPKQSSKSIRTPGGNMTTRTTTKQLITVHVQSLRNTMIFSKDFEDEIVSGDSSVVMKSGDDDVLGELLRKCFKKAADGIAEKFSVKLTLKIKGAKDDDEFDSDDATITLNGREVSVGESIVCVKAEHTVKVEMDDYETFEKVFDFSKEKGAVTKTISLKKKVSAE